MSVRHVTAVRPVDSALLFVTFDTGETRCFDTRPYQTSAFFRRLADPAYFSQVCVRQGTVAWPEGHDFDPGTMYARSAPLPAAPVP